MTATIPWLHKVIVQPTLSFMSDETGIDALSSKSAQTIMLGIAAVESDLRFTRQIRNGPARSYAQVEPITALDIVDRYGNKAKFREMVYSFRPTDVPNTSDERFYNQLRYDQAFAFMCARLKLWDSPKALPEWNDVDGQAAYWKEFYNTQKGSGNPDHYIKAFGRHGVLPYMAGQFVDTPS